MCFSLYRQIYTRIEEYIEEWITNDDSTVPFDLETLYNNIVEDNREYSHLTCVILMSIVVPYIPNGVQILRCGLRIYDLPPLPSTIKHVFCNRTMYIPELPEGVESFVCKDVTWCNPILYLPKSLRILDCHGMFISSLPSIPPNLEYLDYQGTCIKDFITDLPPTLKTLLCGNISRSRIGPLPPALEYFSCMYHIVGQLPPFPPSLKTIIIPKYTQEYITGRLTNYIQTWYTTCYPSSTCLDFAPFLEELSQDMKNDNEYDKYMDRVELEIPYIPDGVETLLCCGHIYTLPPLPSSLKVLRCTSMRTLTELPPCLEVFDCTGSDIRSLPPLPDTLRELRCAHIRLHTWYSNLPPRLEVFICNHSQHITGELTRSYEHTLPELPSTLRILKCYCCILDKLPALPASLEVLDCGENFLLELGTLPDSLRTLYCDYNYLKSLGTLPRSLETIQYYHNLFDTVPEIPPTVHVRTKCDCESESGECTYEGSELFQMHLEYYTNTIELRRRRALQCVQNA